MSTQCETQDARRERYAAALYEDANPGFRWVDIPDSAADTVYWLDKAVAVMAVADAEISDARSLADAEVAELEGEVETLRSAHADLYQRCSEKVADVEARHDDAVRALNAKKRQNDVLRDLVRDLYSEKDRLSAELITAKATALQLRSYLAGLTHALPQEVHGDSPDVG